MTRELLDEVLAHPDDDIPRRVYDARPRIYADWLSDRGDPRGTDADRQRAVIRNVSGAPARSS